MSNEITPNPDRERNPLTEMFVIAAPTIATMATYTVMQFADKIMVSRIEPASPVYVAAQGNGGMWTWIAIGFVIGLVGVINTYVAQHVGKGESGKGSAYGWVGVWISLAFWVLLVPYAIAIPFIFKLLGHEGQLLVLETQYAQIGIFGAVFTMVGRGVAQFFFGLHRARVPLVAAIVAVVVNLFANWVLIFGNLGAPELGVAGAAIGTVIGSLTEMLVLLLVFLGPKYSRDFGTRSVWKPKIAPIVDVLKLGWPGALMMVNEMLCWGYLMTGLLPTAGRAAGQSGDLHNAVGWIALQYMHIAFMPAAGMSIALTAIVGRCMGMKRPDLAVKRAWLGMYLTVGYMGTCGLLMVVFRDEAVRLFIDKQTPPEMVEQMVALGGWVLILASVFQIFDALGMAMTGVLRGAGDTVWPGVMSIALCWTVLIGGGHAMIHFWPQIGSIGPWAAASGYIIVLGLLLFVRFLGGKWKTMEVIREEGVPSLTQTGPDEDLTAPPDAISGVSPGAP